MNDQKKKEFNNAYKSASSRPSKKIFQRLGASCRTVLPFFFVLREYLVIIMVNSCFYIRPRAAKGGDCNDRIRIV